MSLTTWDEHYAAALAHFRQHWALDVAPHTPLHRWLSEQRLRHDFSERERQQLDAINFFDAQYNPARTNTADRCSLDPIPSWTVAEDQFLIEQVDLPVAEQAATLGRGIDAVSRRRQFLGLVRRQRAVQRMGG